LSREKKEKRKKSQKKYKKQKRLKKDILPFKPCNKRPQDDRIKAQAKRKGKRGKAWLLDRI